MIMYVCICLHVPVVPLIPVLIPMIIDVADGTDVESDLIIWRANEADSQSTTGG